MATPAALLAELVALPSVHPNADPGGTRPGEEAIAAWVAEELRHLGAAVETRRLAPGRPSVVATFEPVGQASATVLLAPHLDTVGVRGMTVPPFRLTRRGDRLYGRGSCDTKGPMAALLWALGQWARRPLLARSRVRWVVAATAGEEQGSLGAQQLANAGLRADFAVALEPTRLRVVNAAKGVLRLWIEADGRAAHGSQPDRGVNAIERLLPFAQAVRNVIAPQLRRRPHPLLGAATVNLGIIEGGRELNIVPEYCKIGLDIRTHPHWSEASVRRLIDRVRRECAPHAKVSLERSAPSFISSRNNEWALRLRRCGHGWDTADWFCDANIFAACQIPSVAFGPGSIAQAHTKNEYIQARDLEEGARAFLKFLCTSNH